MKNSKVNVLVNASRIAYVLAPGTGLGTALMFLAGVRAAYEEEIEEVNNNNEEVFEKKENENLWDF
jgi:hypothetical protein